MTATRTKSVLGKDLQVGQFLYNQNATIVRIDETYRDRLIIRLENAIMVQWDTTVHQNTTLDVCV